MKSFEDFSRVFVSFSGGKDSVASYIKVKEKFPAHKIVLVFTDTGHEMPETYQYLKWFDETIFPVVRLTQTLVSQDQNTKRRSLELTHLSWDVSIEKFKEMKIVTIFDEIMYRHNSNPTAPMWPGNGLRYCTKALKINPFFKYIHSIVPKQERKDILIVKGLRQEESNKRADTPEFAVDEVGGDFYNVWHPVYSLTTEEIFDLHRQKDIKINPVYNIRERSNCVGCPFAKNKEIRNTVRVYPDIFNPYIEIEKLSGWSWKNGASLEDVVKGTVEDSPKEDLSCSSGYCDI